MATRKITRKVRVVEPDLTNPIYTHEWSVEDNTDYASINNFYLTYNNINYYFTKPNTIEIGDKFYFNIDTKVLKLNEDTISTSTTGSSNNELSFVPSHKWSSEYINIGANAENVFCSDGKTVEEKLGNLSGSYVEKTGDTMTGSLITPGLTVGTRKTGTIGTNSFAQGKTVLASGNYSHAEGYNTTASGYCSHAEGQDTVASNQRAHAEGVNTTASATDCHAEGLWTTASATGAHAEGNGTQASNSAAHAEGYGTTASGGHSHAEGYSTIASGWRSHAEGNSTIAQRENQHVEGKYNIADSTGSSTTNLGTYVHIVGNGAADDARSNAYTLDWAGNAWFAGDIYIKSNSGTDKDEGSKKLATEEYVETNGGKIDSISIDSTPQTIDANKNVNLTGLEKIANKVTSLAASSTNDQYPSAKAVYDEINTKISTVYKAKGTCTFANKPVLNASSEGFVYNISDAFTTTSDFVEGAGKNYPIGTNIVVINNGTSEVPNWKYDVLAGMTDLSGYVKKTGDTMTGALTTTSLTVGSRNTETIGTNSATLGGNLLASGNYSVAEGRYSEATNNYSHAEGYYSEANGTSSHAEGTSRAKGGSSHSEGQYTLAAGSFSHAENGYNATFSLVISGDANTTTYTTTDTKNARIGSIIKYNDTLFYITAITKNESITLDRTLSSGAVLENQSITGYHSSNAMGQGAHAEGASVAIGNYSHSEGYQTIAKSQFQHVQGAYNIEDSTGNASSKGTYINIIGNGASETTRSNAHTLDWAGNAWFKGDVYVKGTNQTTGSKKLATEESVTAVSNSLNNYALKDSLNNYAPKASPALTGTPTAPTATAGTNSTQIATTAFVGTALNNKIRAQTTDPGVGATLATGNIILVYE